MAETDEVLDEVPDGAPADQAAADEQVYEYLKSLSFSTGSAIRTQDVDAKTGNTKPFNNFQFGMVLHNLQHVLGHPFLKETNRFLECQYAVSVVTVGAKDAHGIYSSVAPNFAGLPPAKHGDFTVPADFYKHLHSTLLQDFQNLEARRADAGAPADPDGSPVPKRSGMPIKSRR